jgi:Cu+-exporting ATPase
VDGVITEGLSAIDESMITGESIPVEKNPGDSVKAGTVNGLGAFKFKAEKVGDETTLAGIIKLIEEAQGSKAPVQRLADRIASVFVPSVLAIAVITFICWMIFGGAFAAALNAAVAVLVIACPCALGLATPAAVMVGSGVGAKSGILIKNAAALENLGKAKNFVFDKTGTITAGKPAVMGIISTIEDDDGVMRDAYSLENNSGHPLASAIINNAKEHGLSAENVENFTAIPGKGVRGVINGTPVMLGNRKWMEENNVDLKTVANEIDGYESEGKTIMILSRGGKLAGVIAAEDPIKNEAEAAVAALEGKGIRVEMLSGDSTRAVEYIASKAGVENVMADMKPEDKLAEIKRLQVSGITVMVGDGINDAPALAKADIGIALFTGTDVAMESGDIVLMKNDLMLVVKAYNLSRNTLAKIKQNLFWAFFYNIIGIPLAAFGLLSPMLAGTAMALSSVCVVTNSLLLNNKKI